MAKPKLSSIFLVSGDDYEDSYLASNGYNSVLKEELRQSENEEEVSSCDQTDHDYVNNGQLVFKSFATMPTEYSPIATAHSDVKPRAKFRDVDGLLIDLIKARPILWDTSCDDFKRTELKPKIWMDLAKMLGPQFTGEEVMTRFKNLKDTFMKNHKKMREENKQRQRLGVNDVIYQPKWKHFNQLKFLIKVRNTLRPTTNIFLITKPQQEDVIENIELQPQEIYPSDMLSTVVIPSTSNGSMAPSSEQTMTTSPVPPPAELLTFKCETIDNTEVVAQPETTSAFPAKRIAEPVSEESITSFQKKAPKKIRTSAIDDALNAIKEIMGQPQMPDRREQFGHFIASELRQVDDSNLSECMLATHQFLSDFIKNLRKKRK